MTTQDRATWRPVLGALAIWAVVLVMSTYTALHSDSWWPLLTIWGLGLALGSGLLVARMWAWGVAWAVATIGGAIGYLGAVVILVFAYGH